METQKTPNSQSSLEKEEWSRRNPPSWLQIILQSYRHQDSIVLVQKQNIDQWKKIADDTTLMAESEVDLNNLLMKVKEESEKLGLKLNIQKN